MARNKIASIGAGQVQRWLKKLGQLLVMFDVMEGTPQRRRLDIA